MARYPSRMKGKPRRLLPSLALAGLSLAALGPLTWDAPPAAGAQLKLPGVKAPAKASEGTEAARNRAVENRNAVLNTLRDPSGWGAARARIVSKVVDFVPALGAAFIVLLVFYLLYRMSARLLHGLLRRTRADQAVLDVGTRLIKFVLLGMGVVMAASQLGFEVGSVLAGLGIVGLALGLAAQDTLANLVAGITILWDHPFRIGDNVTISDIYGQVKEIGLRTTRITTVDKIDAILPNKDVINEKILNHTLTAQLRLRVPVGIGYGEDVAEARKVLLAAIAEHPLLIPEPAPKVVVTELAESAVNLELRVWLRDARSEREALCEMLELVKAALDRAGIEIPFPQRTLWLPDGVTVRQAAPPSEPGRDRRTDPDSGLAEEAAEPPPAAKP